MMVPRSRLLWLAGVWVAPLNLAAVLLPERAPLLIAAMAPALLVAILDAWLARRGLAGLRVELPIAARHTLGREGSLQAVVVMAFERGNRPVTAGLRLDFPPALDRRPLRLAFRLEGPGARAVLRFPVHPVERGHGRVASWRLDRRSPLGFWDHHVVGEAACEVKVYPDLGLGKSGFASPENREAGGVHRAQLLGKGWEFEKLREYIPGDDFHDIHWKATARKGVPVTKTFQVENTQQVYAILDISRFSALPFPETSGPGRDGAPLEYYLRAALRLGLAAERQGDYYGLVLHGERPEAFVRAGKGKAHYGVYRDALYNVRSLPGSPDYPEIFSALKLRLRKRALLLFFCDLEDPAAAESFLENVSLVSRQHLVSVHMIRPPGIHAVFGERPVATAADVYARLSDQLYLQNLASVTRALKRQGVAFQAWEPARFSLEAVSRYLEAKRRQALA